MKKICTILISLLSVCANSAPELKGNPQELRGFLHPEEKIVTITGDAEKKAYSDKAIVSVVITTENKRLSDAISENGEFRKKITKTLMSKGIDGDSIKSSKFSTSPQFGWFDSKPSSYKIVNRMAISITKEDHLKEIAAVADTSKEVEISDTEFEHTKKEEFDEKVKAEALEKVLKQKAFYEKSLGVKLVPVGFRDSYVHQRATRGAMILEEVVVTARKREDSSYSFGSNYSDEVQVPSFDEVVYEANVSVDFRIDG